MKIFKTSLETTVSKSSVHTATKLLHSKTYKFTIVQNLLEAGHALRTRFCNWFFVAVCSGEVNPLLIYFTEQAWLHLNGHINTRNSRHWSADIPRLIHKVPVHDLKFGVWCITSMTKIIRPISLLDTINSGRYIGQILAQYFENSEDEMRDYGFFQQDGTTVHTAWNSMTALWKMFGDQIISHSLWPAYSAILTPCLYYLWGSLKDSAYKSNPHTQDRLK